MASLNRALTRTSQPRTPTPERPRLSGAEQRLKALGIDLPAPPEPFSSYVEAVQTGSLLFLSGRQPSARHPGELEVICEMYG
jgi:hypothetical protein